MCSIFRQPCCEGFPARRSRTAPRLLSAAQGKHHQALPLLSAACQSQALPQPWGARLAHPSSASEGPSATSQLPLHHSSQSPGVRRWFLIAVMEVLALL